jgi:hypothetical protein
MGIIRTKSLYIVVGLTAADLLIGAFPLKTQDDCMALQKVLEGRFQQGAHHGHTRLYLDEDRQPDVYFRDYLCGPVPCI